jgi:hypothetical protein
MLGADVFGNPGTPGKAGIRATKLAVEELFDRFVSK